MSRKKLNPMKLYRKSLSLDSLILQIMTIVNIYFVPTKCLCLFCIISVWKSSTIFKTTSKSIFIKRNDLNLSAHYFLELTCPFLGRISLLSNMLFSLYYCKKKTLKTINVNFSKF